MALRRERVSGSVKRSQEIHESSKLVISSMSYEAVALVNRWRDGETRFRRLSFEFATVARVRLFTDRAHDVSCRNTTDSRAPDFYTNAGHSRGDGCGILGTSLVSSAVLLPSGHRRVFNVPLATPGRSDPRSPGGVQPLRCTLRVTVYRR